MFSQNKTRKSVLKYNIFNVVMANVIKLRKGLDINLTGKASKDVAIPVVQASEYALVPAAFVGVTPKVVLRYFQSLFLSPLSSP